MKSICTRELMGKLLREGLRLETRSVNNRLEIVLLFDEQEISSDFVDYAEVVRVVDRLNNGMYH